MNLSSATKSQAMSALIKSVRLRRVEDTAKWWLYLWNLPGMNKWMLARRVLICAAEDCLEPSIHSLAGRWFRTAHFDTNPGNGLFILMMIMQTPNYWLSVRGHQYVYQWRLAEKMVKSSKKNSLSILDILGSDTEFHRTSLVTALCSHFLSLKNKVNRLEYATALVNRARVLGNIGARITAQVAADHPKALAMDDNYLGQALYGLYQPLGLGLTLDTQAVSQHTHYMLVVADDWLVSSGPHVPPSWALDGIHTGGADKRFAGTLPNMVGMCNALSTHGRLDPDDPWEDTFFSLETLEAFLGKEEAKHVSEGYPQAV